MSARGHMRFAIALCAVFLAIGIWLEAMYGLRAEGWIEDEIRREFLRLGHAHGALLGLLNIGIAVAMERLQTPDTWARKIRIAGLLGAALVGVGFFTAGLWHGPTDPGPTVLMVPAGAFMLVASLAAIVVLRPADVSS